MLLTVPVAVVGFGSIARSHLSALRALPVTRALAVRPVISAIVSERAATIRDEAGSFGVNRVVTSLDEVLSDPEIALVDVASRNDRHAAEAGAVLAAGRALYVEKPVGRTPDEAMEVAARAADSRVIAQPGLVMRYDPQLARARALVRDGAIGTVRHGSTGSYHGSYLDPRRAMSWRLRSSSAGGGAMLDLGVHVIDAMRLLLGDLSVVRASARTVVAERPDASGGTGHVDVDDWAWAELATADGMARLTVEASRISLGAEGMPFALYGTDGSLVGDFGAGRLALRRFDGREAEYMARASQDPGVTAVAELRPPARLSLGSFVDLHAAALHHCLLRVAGMDPAPGLAPTLDDAVAAETIAHEIVRRGREA